MSLVVFFSYIVLRLKYYNFQNKHWLKQEDFVEDSILPLPNLKGTFMNSYSSHKLVP